MFLTFGEIMLRMMPEDRLRLAQALPGRLNVTFGGGEANVAVTLAQFGAAVRYLTAVPDNALGHSARRALRGLGVDVEHVLLRKQGRMGIYFVEAGADQRSSTVLYDRAHSAAALAAADEYAMDAALEGVGWVHVTGITPAISENAFLAAAGLVDRAKAAGASVSCDLNFRKKLWRWRRGTEPRELARECLSRILARVDLAIGNEEDAADIFGIEAEGTSVEAGVLNAAAYERVARELVARFPNLARVAITLRQSLSADRNNWGGMLYDAAERRAYFAPLDAGGAYRPYEIRDIVDRVGGGDAFCGGLLYALNSEAFGRPAEAVRFAAAASCLKHSVHGDFNLVDRDEVIGLMKGQASGRVRR